jgi:hypothetical protein
MFQSKIFLKLAIALIFGLLFFRTPFICYSQISKKSTIDIVIQDELVSLHARNADIRDVLNQLSAKAQMTFEVDNRMTETITIDMVDVPIDKAIKQIAKNWAIVYAVDPSTGQQKIEKIGVFDSSKTSNQSSYLKNLQGKPKSDLLDKNLDPRTRMQLVRSAHQAPDWQAKEALRYLLLDDSEPRPLRITAARSLVKANDVESIDLIMKVIDQTDDDNLKYGLAMTLGETNHPNSISVLSNYAEEATNSTLRYKSIQSLMKIKDPASVDTYKQAAKKDPDKYNRAKAIIALGNTDDSALIPFLEALKENEQDDFVRHVCQKQIDMLSD